MPESGILLIQESSAINMASVVAVPCADIRGLVATSGSAFPSGSSIVTSVFNRQAATFVILTIGRTAANSLLMTSHTPGSADRYRIIHIP